MKFARWETLENLKELINLSKVNGKEKIKKSGLPIAYDNENLYIDSRNGHSLIIGSNGSGKTQAITLPMLNLAWLASESIIVSDSSDELYETTSEKFKENGYNIIRINFDEAINTHCWNPFEIVKKHYDEKNFDKVSDELESIANYLLNGIEEVNSDPFWINSAISYFTGISLYILSIGKALNLDEIYDTNNVIKENPDKFIKSLDKHSSVYINLASILTAPNDTRMSIISVFDNKFKLFFGRENLKKLLSKSDFDINRISEEKNVIYIKAGKTKISDHLLPLFIEQVYETKNDVNKLNIIIDEFYNLNPIADFSKMLNYSRSVNICFTILIRGFNDLKNTYGKEETDIIKLNFSNIVYLLSQDNETLEEISNMCGYKSKDDSLISVEDLKTLKQFEAIILTTRMMPFKTRMLPYYEIELNEK